MGRQKIFIRRIDAKMQLQLLLVSVYILVTQMTSGAFGKIFKSPLNRVVYEGSTNTTITCESDDLFLNWQLSPFVSTASYNNDSITVKGQLEPAFSQSFAIDHSQGTQTYTLVIFNATIYPSGGATLSTAGLYKCYNPYALLGVARAFLVVIRSDPVCSANFTQSTLQTGYVMQASCTIVYATYIDKPTGNTIDAVMTWTVNGQPIPAANATLTINVSPTEVTATSTLLIKDNFNATYECGTSFSPPRTPVSQLDMNAPVYFKTCNISQLPPCSGILNKLSDLLKASCYDDWNICSSDTSILLGIVWPKCRNYCRSLSPMYSSGTCTSTGIFSCPCVHPGSLKCQCS